MSVGTQQHFVARSTQAVAFDGSASLGAHARTSPALRYSSPRPWLLALSISSVMWAGIAWTVWRIF
jgi:hypothetical protein